MAVSGVGSASLEQELQARIRQANERAKETERELEDQLEAKRQQHADRMAHETAKQEGQLASARDKHLERLESLRQRMRQSEGETLRQGQKSLKQTQEQLDDEFLRSTRDGERRTRQLSQRLNNQEEYERLASRNRLDSLKRDNQSQLQNTLNVHQEKMAGIHEANEKKYTELKTNHDQASQRIEEHFETRVKDTLAAQEGQLRRIDADAAKKIEALRASNTSRLDAYRDTRSDPFYRGIALRADLTEGADGYVLTARIPQHEQQHVSINVRGNQIVLSGKRQAKERIDSGPGETLETASFQSFSKTFPITWPVEPTYLKKEFLGDTLIVSIPKKEFWEVNPVLRERKTQPERVQAQRPNFPADLPVDGVAPSSTKTPNLG